MLDLVFYSDSTLKAQPYTTPEVIAANTGIKRRNVIDLIVRNMPVNTLIATSTGY